MIVSSNISPSLAFHCVSGFQFYTRVNSPFFLSTGYFFTGPAPKVLSVEDCKNKKKESEANFLGGTSKKNHPVQTVALRNKSPKIEVEESKYGEV